MAPRHAHCQNGHPFARPVRGAHLAQGVAIDLLRHALVVESAAAGRERGRRVTAQPWGHPPTPGPTADQAATEGVCKTLSGYPAPIQRPHFIETALHAPLLSASMPCCRAACCLHAIPVCKTHSLESSSISTFFCVPLGGYAMLICKAQKGCIGSVPRAPLSLPADREGRSRRWVHPVDGRAARRSTAAGPPNADSAHLHRGDVSEQRHLGCPDSPGAQERGLGCGETFYLLGGGSARGSLRFNGDR